jgi:hypothetical protein
MVDDALDASYAKVLAAGTHSTPPLTLDSIWGRLSPSAGQPRNP